MCRHIFLFTVQLLSTASQLYMRPVLFVYPGLSRGGAVEFKDRNWGAQVSLLELTSTKEILQLHVSVFCSRQTKTASSALCAAKTQTTYTQYCAWTHHMYLPSGPGRPGGWAPSFAAGRRWPWGRRSRRGCHLLPGSRCDTAAEEKVTRKSWFVF